jgi:hypothetical protein
MCRVKGVLCGSGCGWRPKRRGRFRLICEGWLPQDGLFVAPGPLPRIERASTLAGAHNRIAGPVWRTSAATPTSNGMGCRSVRLAGDLPDEAGQLARDGDRDGGAALGAAPVEVRPALGESQLRAPSGLDRVGGLAVLAAPEGQ